MNSMDLSALFKISYGLYVVTCNDGKKNNGVIVNTVMQFTDSPLKVGVCINKVNYSHDVIKQTGLMNVNCLTTDTPFDIIKKFGFQSGRDADKFENLDFDVSKNSLPVLKSNINAFMSLKVIDCKDLDTHTLFICEVSEAETKSSKDSLTYDYYHKNIKPKPDTKKKKGFVCKICGYVYEGEELPPDFICPLCKHGVQDFEEIK